MFHTLLASAQTLEDTKDVGTQQDSYVIHYLRPSVRLYGLLQRTSDGYCVSFIQNNGYGHLKGNAKDWIRYKNSKSPVIGGVVILDESKWGHLALIVDYTDTEIRLVEQNYIGLGIVSRRTIPRDYENILGFIQ